MKGRPVEPAPFGPVAIIWTDAGALFLQDEGILPLLPR